MTDKNTIHINLDAKCQRCGKGGATQSGICLPCFNKALKNGEFDHIIKKYKPKHSTIERGIYEHR